MFYWGDSKEGGKQPTRGAAWQVGRCKQSLSCMWLKAGSQSLERHSSSPQACDTFHQPFCHFELMATEKFTAVDEKQKWVLSFRVYLADSKWKGAPVVCKLGPSLQFFHFFKMRIKEISFTKWSWRLRKIMYENCLACSRYSVDVSSMFLFPRRAQQLYDQNIRLFILLCR